MIQPSAEREPSRYRSVSSGMPAMVTRELLDDRQAVGLGCPLHPLRHRQVSPSSFDLAVAMGYRYSTEAASEWPTCSALYGPGRRFRPSPMTTA